MLSKAKISSIRKLAQKKFRDEAGVCIVEGTKSVLDLLRSSLEVRELYATPAWKATYGGAAGCVRCEEVTAEELERISCLTTPQDVLAIAELPRPDIRQLSFHEPILVLDGIRDPGNMGTIIRTADWFGIRQVVCSPDSVELANPKTIQATMGSFTRMKVFYTDLPNFLSDKRIEGEIYGTFMEGTDIRQTVCAANSVIVIGNEGKGISPEVAQCITKKIHIPSGAPAGDHAESLNASIAAAIVMYWMR